MLDKDIITDYENLYRAYKKAKSGKRFNSNTAKFQIMALDGIITLQKQLREQTYTMGKYNEFEIYEPKRRLIKSCSFRILAIVSVPAPSGIVTETVVPLSSISSAVGFMMRLMAKNIPAPTISATTRIISPLAKPVI